MAGLVTQVGFTRLVLNKLRKSGEPTSDAIHAFFHGLNVDARHKAGHDAEFADGLRA
jgi:phage tail tape-measure protein